MDWLGGFIKTFTDYFRTREGLSVLIAIILTAIITIVLEHAIPAFGRFLWTLLKAIWRSPQMLKKWFRDWRYWRRFGARYEAVSMGDLQIEKKTSGQSDLYVLTLPFTLKFENRDDLKQMLVECKDMQFGIDSEVVNGRRIPYLLNPVEGHMTFWLPASGKSGEKRYIASGYSDTKPRLIHMALCRMTRPGTISVGVVTRPIKVKPFSIKVDWSKIEKSTSHK